MSAWGAMGPGTRLIVLAFGGAVTVGAGYLGWQAANPFDTTSGAAPQAVVSLDTGTAAVTDPPAQPDAVADAEPARSLPGIDTWRVAPDGEALVAGLALPLARIVVLVDGAEVAEGTALASGEFVVQFTLAPNPAPSLMTLAMTAPNASTVTSEEMVAVGPIPGPPVSGAQVAGAEPGPLVVAALGDDASGVTAEGPVATDAALPPAALLVTGDGAVVLQDAAAADPLLMSQVMIDTITYTPAGDVQVGGRGTAGATLRLYLDTAEVASLQVPKDGLWALTLGDTAPGVYTLRVDQVDGTGAVTSRFETPFQRETLEALALVAEEPAPATLGDAAPDSGSEAALAVVEGATAAAMPEPVLLADPAPETVAEPASEAASGPVSEPAPEAATETAALVETAPAATPLVSVTVQPGFTLWGIAQDQMGDGVMYVQVFDANRDKIKNPDLIYPGQVLTVPANP